jgi:predicted dehydrogenase
MTWTPAVTARLDDAPAARVALLGYGTAGRVFHAPLIATTPGLVLTTVVTRSSERAAEVAADHPGARVVATADDVWAAADELDLVVIATPNDSHVPLATAAIRAGLPVVVDKPVGLDAAQVSRLRSVAEAAGVPVSAFHNRRWDTDVVTLKAAIARGDLGDVHRFESRMDRWRPQPRPGAWREALPAEAGGGLLLDLGTHLVDQATHLFGPVSSVYAETAVRRVGPQGEDDVFIALRHRSGVLSHLGASALAGDPRPRMRVRTSAGEVVVPEWDPQEAALRAGTPVGAPGWGVPAVAPALHVGDEVRPVPVVPGDYPAFYRRVQQALTGAGTWPVPLAEALAVAQVVDAARISARTHDVVHV